MADTVELGRQAFGRRAWGEAFGLLTANEPLAAEDLERLAVAASLLGRDDESARAWERAHVEHGRQGDVAGAAACAFWLGLSFFLRGQSAQAGGWFARAERLAGEVGDPCATSGFVMVPEFLRVLWSGAPDRAHSMAGQIVEIAHRSGDRDLLAFGLLCLGEALIALGEITAGMKQLDEAMVSVTTGEVSPITAGIVYCGVIESCVDAFDLRRAAEWTDALHQWCVTQPDLVPYRGQCSVHRSQVLQARGAWSDAVFEAEQARQWLAAAAHPAVGVACYQLGELHRVRGDFAEADEAYRAAHRFGMEPAPGHALLRLAEGDVAAAVGVLARMVEETRSLRTQPTVLAAAVEAHLAAGDVAAARGVLDELAKLTTASAAPLQHAVLACATGSVALGEGDPWAALVELRRGCAGFAELEMPYEVARARTQIALTCRALDDEHGADLELDEARATFERLGAKPDLARVRSLARPARAPRPDGLTERECEVLRAVSTGRTNREVASALSISEHTVARHLQNIFSKLGLSSRAAATTYAHSHGLV